MPDDRLVKLLNTIDNARNEVDEKLAQRTRGDENIYPHLVGRLLGHICLIQAEINKIAKEVAIA
jgi:hypothetical protein